MKSSFKKPIRAVAWLLRSILLGIGFLFVLFLGMKLYKFYLHQNIPLQLAFILASGAILNHIWRKCIKK